MSSSAYDVLSDQELRNRLLQHGYNLPVSINRDFLLKKLISVESKTGGSGGSAGKSATNASNKRRQTIAVAGSSDTSFSSTTRGRSRSKESESSSNSNVNANSNSNTNGLGNGRSGTPTSKRASLNPQPKSRQSLPAAPSPVVPRKGSPSPARKSITGRKATPTNRLLPSNANFPATKLPFSPRAGNTSTPVRKSTPPVYLNNDSSGSGTDDEEVEDITQDYPTVPPRSLAKPPSSPVRRAPNPMSRRSIHDPPQPATPNTERRLDGIDLSLFRGSGRGEGSFSTPMTSSSPAFGRRSNILYTSKQYSDDDDTQEEDEDEQTNPISRRLNFNLSSKLKTVAGYLNPFAYTSFFGRKRAGAIPSRALNGQVAYRNGKPKSAPSGWKNWFDPGTAGEMADAPSTIAPNSSHISTLIVTFFIIFFVIIGGSYYYMLLGGSGGGTTPSKNAIQTHPPLQKPGHSKPKTSFIPICGLDGVDNAFCINTDEAKPSKRLFDLLKTELAERKQWKGCGAEVKDKISLSVANTLLYRLSNFPKSEVDKCFRSMLILAVENPSWGLKIEKQKDDLAYEILKSTELVDLDYEKAKISYGENLTGITVWFCSFWSFLLAMAQWLFTFALVGGVCYICIKIGMKFWDARQREQREVFECIKHITQVLQTQYEQSSSTGADPFLAVNHIRDELFTPEERLAKMRVWEKVMDYISTHESRIREEIQHISGEEYRVWRWIPTTSPVSLRKSLSPMHNQSHFSPSTSSSIPPSTSPAHLESVNPTNQNQWQGQAFDMNEGSPNAVPKSPTPCLKIRQMFNPNSTESPDKIRTKVEAAIRRKLMNCNVLHVGIDTRSQEGCVYIRCASKNDARNAYMELHGWWFDGKLLSVKFLREERYLERFPEGTN